IGNDVAAGVAAAEEFHLNFTITEVDGKVVVESQGRALIAELSDFIDKRTTIFEDLFDEGGVLSRKRATVGALAVIEVFLQANVRSFFAVGGAGTEEVHALLCFGVSDDRHGWKGVDVQAVAEIVVIVKVGVQKKADGLVSPLLDLCDVVTGDRREVRRID